MSLSWRLQRANWVADCNSHSNLELNPYVRHFVCCCTDSDGYGLPFDAWFVLRAPYYSLHVITLPCARFVIATVPTPEQTYAVSPSAAGHIPKRCTWFPLHQNCISS